MVDIPGDRGVLPQPDGGAVMTEPLIPLPEPREQSPEDYLQISNRALQQARLHLQQRIHLSEGDRLQASEKVSGAVASRRWGKAIGQHRNWQHDSHALRTTIVSQLGAELGQPTPGAQTLYRGRAAANEQHQNYYDNVLFEEDILQDIGFAEAFVQVIEQVIAQLPRPFTVSRSSEAHRISQLTGHRPDIGDTDALGFANFEGALRGE